MAAQALSRTVVKLQDAALTAHETELQRTLLAIFRLGGFTTVQRSIDKARKELARNHRAAVDAEGWVV